MSRPSASELREALRAGLVERLAPDGWRLVGEEGDRRVALVRPVADEFVATIDVWQESSSPDRPPVVVTFMHAGVGYEPLRRLAPLLGMFGLDVQDACVWPEAFAQDEDEDEHDDDDDWDDGGEDIEGAEEQDEDAEDEDDEWHGRELRTVAEADQLAGELAAVALERALPYASPSMSKLWRESRAASAAVDAVRRDGEGNDRSQQRAMLQRELAERGVSESPLWIEQKLDHLHDGPAEKRELLIGGLIGAGKLGIKAFTAIRERHSLPDLSVPEWLEPPARAAWPVPRQYPARWAEVQIHETSREWLDGVYQAIPRLFGSTALLETWLTWDTDDNRCVAVHIGERRVGALDEAATGAYRDTMDAAGERDESPYTQARLTPRPGAGKYLLEVQLPA